MYRFISALGKRAVSSDHSSVDITVSEDERADDVQNTRGDSQDTRGQDEAPEGEPQLLAGVMGRVELPKNI
ncbi:hypothetical protein HG530_001009 [Fusarium avenaceum]|nr:hypothetical protein HG530_001009 [Fusarium avenaceum]